MINGASPATGSSPQANKEAGSGGVNTHATTRDSPTNSQTAAFLHDMNDAEAFFVGDDTAD
jgi:hypothetical protein